MIDSRVPMHNSSWFDTGTVIVVFSLDPPYHYHNGHRRRHHRAMFIFDEPVCGPVPTGAGACGYISYRPIDKSCGGDRGGVIHNAGNPAGPRATLSARMVDRKGTGRSALPPGFGARLDDGGLIRQFRLVPWARVTHHRAARAFDDSVELICGYLPDTWRVQLCFSEVFWKAPPSPARFRRSRVITRF